jgi:2-succinyl-6-hydroxy-2,4-cyclohexadiene-1-carboxylate synthase
MAYRKIGAGPALVLAPGIAATYRSYALLLNRLAERFTAIHYEYPGSIAGDGAKLRRIGHDHLIEDLGGLLDHLGMGSASLLGISFGATVALGALARWPGRFPGAVVQGAFAYRRYTAAERVALAAGRLVPGTAAGLPWRERVLAWNSRDAFPSAIAPRWRHYVEDNGRTRVAGLAHRCDLLARLDLRPRLASIESRVLILRGNEDRIVPKGLHEELTRGLPNAESRVIPLAGHPMHYTHAELMARVVGEFLIGEERCGADSG